MGKTIKKIALCTAFVLILASILIVSSMLATPDSAHSFNSAAANAILDEPDNSIDVLFLGDSGTYAAVSPMEMYKNYGITSYVCASNAQYLSMSEMFLKQAFEKQKPKIVILEAYSVQRKMRFNVSLTSRVENLFSVFKFHNRWKKIGDYPSFDFLKSTITDDNKGYRYFTASVPVLNPNNYDVPTDSTESVPAANEKVFASILEYCRENGAELILFNVPNMRWWNYEKHNGISELAEKYGVTYVDMNIMDDDVGIDWSKETIDMGDHLNYSGAVKTSVYIGKYLKTNYYLDDHRKDGNYSQWNEALERYLYSVT